jgi:hypothetical protein
LRPLLGYRIGVSNAQQLDRAAQVRAPLAARPPPRARRSRPSVEALARKKTSCSSRPPPQETAVGPRGDFCHVEQIPKGALVYCVGRFPRHGPQEFALPEEFPATLREFTKEVLRDQPSDIPTYGARAAPGLSVVSVRHARAPRSLRVFHEEIASRGGGCEELVATADPARAPVRAATRFRNYVDLPLHMRVGREGFFACRGASAFLACRGASAFLACRGESGSARERRRDLVA